MLKEAGAKVLGWVFNDQFMHYEKEISAWTKLPILGSVPFQENPGKEFVLKQAALMKPVLKKNI